MEESFSWAKLWDSTLVLGGMVVNGLRMLSHLWKKIDTRAQICQKIGGYNIHACVLLTQREAGPSSHTLLQVTSGCSGGAALG